MTTDQNGSDQVGFADLAQEGQAIPAGRAQIADSDIDPATAMKSFERFLAGRGLMYWPRFERLQKRDDSLPFTALCVEYKKADGLHEGSTGSKRWTYLEGKAPR
ncbi:hypothetical protein ACIPIN_00575 [Pseudomonas sp. NPDC087697]|uniref:hypothetical protein n=1 Tax=Pseudomonas sp. NPDC087697 TaxID=3364447 RepID=UPI0037F78A46